MRVLLAQINPTVADLEGNTKKILLAIEHAKKQKADLVLFPELSLTGYPAEDFLLLPHFIAAVKKQLKVIQDATRGVIAVVGTPRENPNRTEKFLFNSAAIFSDGSLVGFQDKMLLPTYDVFNERRYFEPAHKNQIWELAGYRIGITICEDLWFHEQVQYTTYAKDPVEELRVQKPDLMLNLSASPYSIRKFKKRFGVCSRTAQSLGCPLALCYQVGGNDDLIFDGYSFHMDASGHIVQMAKGFEEDFLLIDTSKKASTPMQQKQDINDLYQALVLGVRDYFHKLGFKKACLGLSGGIDSAVVACIATEALGKENVLALGMPSRYSASESSRDAKQLAQNIGIDYREISIELPFQCLLDLLQPHFAEKKPDVTEENMQARIRGALLMAFANKFDYIVLSTGNKSELAMGYATLYGDMCGGLAVLSDVTKRQVYMLARWVNREKQVIPENIIQRAPSAELRPNQKDSDSLEPYDVIDNVVEAYVEEHCSPEDIAKRFHYPVELVQKLIRRIHYNEYKRRQSPPGLRVTEKSFSIGRHIPIVQKWV